MQREGQLTAKFSVNFQWAAVQLWLNVGLLLRCSVIQRSAHVDFVRKVWIEADCHGRVSDWLSRCTARSICLSHHHSRRAHRSVIMIGQSGSFLRPSRQCREISRELPGIAKSAVVLSSSISSSSVFESSFSTSASPICDKILSAASLSSSSDTSKASAISCSATRTSESSGPIGTPLSISMFSRRSLMLADPSRLITLSWARCDTSAEAGRGDRLITSLLLRCREQASEVSDVLFVELKGTLNATLRFKCSFFLHGEFPSVGSAGSTSIRGGAPSLSLAFSSAEKSGLETKGRLSGRKNSTPGDT